MRTKIFNSCLLLPDRLNAKRETLIDGEERKNLKWIEIKTKIFTQKETKKETKKKVTKKKRWI